MQHATRQTLEDEMDNNKMSMRENLSLLFYNYTDSSGPWEIYGGLQYQARVTENRQPLKSPRPSVVDFASALPIAGAGRHLSASPDPGQVRFPA